MGDRTVEQKKSAINDGCPSWADKLIKEIEYLEVKLGNIREPSTWQVTPMEHLYERVFGDQDSSTDASAVETIFSKVVQRLSGEGFDSEAIAAFINRRVGREERLPYCDANEVQQSLATAPSP